MIGRLELFGIAVGLSMDALAVAVATSALLRRVDGHQMFRLSFHFGLFQALMPVIGWTLGSLAADYIRDYDHWIAFFLLAYVGGRALREALFGKDGGDGETRPRTDPTRGWSLIVLSVATSIDALAVGITFAMLGVAVWYPALVIGLVAGTLTLAGMHFGARLGGRFGKGMEVFGGLVLLGIGFKILLEHLLA